MRMRAWFEFSFMDMLAIMAAGSGPCPIPCMDPAARDQEVRACVLCVSFVCVVCVHARSVSQVQLMIESKSMQAMHVCCTMWNTHAHLCTHLRW